MKDAGERMIPSQVLVVDDDEIIREAAKESLMEAGFLVSEVENGVQAMEALEEFRPDIILLDVMMPEMDGFATVGAVRRLPGFETVPVLIMTSLDDLDSIHRAYKAGATDFITKPINWVILVQRVRYMTRATRMMAEQKRLQKELEQAQKMEAVATLAGGVAHDFNNLLQAILGSSELLMMERQEETSGCRELRNIIEAAERGGRLVRQLLTYSRRITSEKRPTQLNDQVHQLHLLLQRTIPKMISIELRLADHLKPVEADAVQVEQVLMNLAINARDAMPEGGRLIIETANVPLPATHGSAESMGAAGAEVLLSVTDTGQGMDPRTLERIFEPFFTTKAPGRGTGLGLSTVHGIVENHDGRITCHSAPGKGTCFRIYLPAVDTIRTEQPAEEKRLSHGGHEAILLVDDDEIIRQTCQKLLEKVGYTVLTASRGEEALEIYRYRRRAMPVDLVLLDLIMPGMGGVKCLQKLFEIDPSVKVIIISGHSPEEKVMQAGEVRACGYLRKPYTGKELFSTIRGMLDGD